jgi:hypothetical protein
MAVGIGLLPRDASSLPLYARQTGQPCATCHTAFLELTPFGRHFKLGGYTLGGGDWKGPPFAVMLQAPTYTHTEAGQEGGAAPHFGPNNNFAFQQASLFTGGRITDNLGAFIQGTYDGVARRFGWDNVDIRYANSVNLQGHNLLWGVTANNNPTVQDVWNTIPAWSFPYVSSALAPSPTASTFIAEVYAQQVAGLTAYGFLDDLFYFEFGGYRPLSTNTQLVLGVDTTGQSPINGVAPYWRLAVEPNFGNHSWEIGSFGLASKVVPTGLSGAGTDSFTDIGIDTQYQYLGDPHTVTARLAWIHENHNTSASQTLGLADNSNNQLRSLNASLSYIYDKTWSFTAGRMSIGGTPVRRFTARLPAARTAPTGSPRSPICRSCGVARHFGHGSMPASGCSISDGTSLTALLRISMVPGATRTPIIRSSGTSGSPSERRAGAARPGPRHRPRRANSLFIYRRVAASLPRAMGETWA